MNKIFAFLLFFAIAIICFSVFNIKTTLPIQNISLVEGKIGETPIKLEVSSNAVTRSKGLSNRPSLNEGEGMLFVFLENDEPGFWMKDMKFPIDIIWISEDLRVVDADLNVKPSTFPKVFYPSEPIKYVIEAPAGFFESHNLKIGYPVSIESQNLILERTF